MSAHVRPALSAVTFLAAALSLAVHAPNGAHAADACLTAPNRQAPQGSHWYYRIERPSLRKCWRLAAKDGKEQRATARAAQPAPDDETAAAPAPAADRPAERQAEPEAPPPTPVKTLVTRNVSSTNDAAPLPPSEPSANTVPGADAPAPAATIPQPPAKLDQPVPQPVVASVNADTTSQDGAPTWGHLLAAIALLGLLSSAAFLFVHIVRRRTDVMNTLEDAGGPPNQTSATAPASAAPTFAPLPPMAVVAREDDVDQALRRFAGNVRRRAA